MLDTRLWDVLACPACGSPLKDDGTEAVCAGCSARYPITRGQVDLHLREPKAVEMPVTVRPFGDDDPRYLTRPSPIPMNPNGPIDRDAFAYDDRLWFGNGLTRELTSWLPAGTDEQILLDLGCGHRRVEPVLRMTGMSYLGIDVAGAEPDVLGVAEAIPVKDESVDLVFSLAVLPHTKRPWLASREVARVLRPGCLFIGTSQFLEPCDMQSRHHASALGVLDWLEEGGFDVVAMEANVRWTGFRAMSQMGYFPKQAGIDRAVAATVEGLHRAYRSVYRAVKRNAEEAPLGEGLPERYTGGFRFVARKRD